MSAPHQYPNYPPHTMQQGPPSQNAPTGSGAAMWRTGYPSSSPSPQRMPSAAYMAQQQHTSMVPPGHHMTAAGPLPGSQPYMGHPSPQSHLMSQKARMQQPDMYHTPHPQVPPHQQHQQQIRFHQVNMME